MTPTDDEAKAANAALITVPETQSRLEIGMIILQDRFGLDDERSAGAAAPAAALLIKDTAQVLDPSTGFGIAAYGCVEGAKTVPQRLPDLTPVTTKKPWYKSGSGDAATMPAAPAVDSAPRRSTSR